MPRWKKSESGHQNPSLRTSTADAHTSLSLTLNELKCLLWILGAMKEVESAQQFQQQVDSLTVATRSVMHIELIVSPNAPVAALPDGPLDVMPFACGASGEPLGHTSVWIEQGRLSRLSFSWVTDDMSDDFSPAHLLTL